VIPQRDRRRDGLTAGILLASLLLAYLAVLARLARQWLDDANASHGLIVVPLAAWLVWSARGRWRALAPSPTWLGLAIVVASLGGYAAGVLGAELFLARISLVGVAAGTTLFVWGWRHLRLIAFPLILLALAVPLPVILSNQVTLPLQLLASRAGESLIWAAGVPVLREGNVLVLADTTLEVAEACSGIRSLVSLGTLALVAAYFRRGSLAGGATLVASSVPIAVAANAARVAGTGLVAHFVSAEAAEGFFHTFSGWLMFAAAVALMLACERAIARVERAVERKKVDSAKAALEVSCAPAP
jgi:exosortase